MKLDVTVAGATMNPPCSVSPDDCLNTNVKGLTPSATLAINDRSDELRREGREIFKLGLGQSPFPVPAPVVEALRRNAPRKDYLPVKGLLELREIISQHHRTTFGIDCTPEDVLIGPGSKELMFLLQLVYDGDIIIPTPAWVSYAPQARIIGRRVFLLHTRREDGWRLSPEQLETLCEREPPRPRLVILNYPSNPTGTTYEPQELKALAEVARRHRVVVLSDEIYGKIHHKGTHTSIVPYYPEGTVFSGGLSKWCGAGGWRLGVFVVPRCLRWLLGAMAAVASETFTSTSAPIQYAAIRAFEGGEEIERYLANCRRILAALGGDLALRLREVGTRVLLPEGGFYLFPDFTDLNGCLERRGIHTSRDLCERLLEETGVAVLPGSDFGRRPRELTVRLAYVDFNGAAALKAAEQVPPGRDVDEAFLREHCSRPLLAVERLCEWLVHAPKRASETKANVEAKA